MRKIVFVFCIGIVESSSCTGGSWRLALVYWRAITKTKWARRALAWTSPV